MITDEIHIPTTKEIEADGFITPQLELERVNLNRAKPVKDCIYPKCEDCKHYHGNYCDVPMVVTKQIYRLTEEKIALMEKMIEELENVVWGEILGSREVDGNEQEDLNLTWSDYFGEDK